jgi:putative copper resistance protein D
VFDAAIIDARLLQYSAALVLFGSSLFFLYGVAPTARWQRLLLISAAAVAVAASVAWLMAETAILTGDPKDAFHGTVLWSVVTDTRIGKFGLLRIALLLLSLIALCAISFSRKLVATQTLLAAAVVMSFAWSGHAVAQPGLAGLLHLVGDVLHLLAAGVWIGALVPITLLLLQWSTPEGSLHRRVVGAALKRFSGVGPAVVAILILTGLLNSAFLIDPAHWSISLQTPYGETLLVKLALFAGMLLLAVLNRFRLVPALTSTPTGTAVPTAVRRLRMSLLTETLLALLVIAAVALLGTLAPPGLTQ